MDFAEKFDAERIYIYLPGEGVSPDFNIFDYAVGFDPICFGDRYCQIHPLTFFNRYLRLGELFARPQLSLHKRHRFCDFIYSNSKANTFRDQFFKELNARKRVDSLGRHLNNGDSKFLRSGYDDMTWRETKIAAQKESRFSIAIENQRQDGYVTEKLLTPIIARSVPIYWGAKDVGGFFNESSFINLDKYSSIGEAIDFILDVENNDSQYDYILNEPFMTRAQVSKYHLMERNLKEFFWKIFSSDLKPQEKRAPIGTHNDIYQQRYLKASFARKSLHSLRKIRRLLTGI